MLTRRWNRRHEARTPEQLGWPLHVKHTSRLNWDQLEQHVHPSLREAWARHAAFFSLQSTLIGTNFPIETFPSDLQPGDLGELITKRYIEQTERHRVRGTVRVFWVAEPNKRRRRLVTHPFFQNDMVPFHKEPDLFPTDDDLLEPVGEPAAACVDMRAFFNQFALPEHLRDFFAFQATNGNWYRLCTIPTGGREPPIVAQIVLLSLARRLEDAFKVKVTSFIDNLRIAGKPDQIKRALTLLFHICNHEFDPPMQINEDLQESLVTDDYTFLGIRFAHKTQSVAVGDLALARLEPLRLEDTVAGALSSFGKGIAASRILGLTVPFHCVKFLRSRVGWPLDAQAEVWPSILEPWNAWIALCKSNVPRDMKKPLAGATIYTDASLSGWGGVLLSRGQVRIVGGRWGRSLLSMHINSLELLAVALTASALDLKDTQLNIFIDNQAALAHVRKPLKTPTSFWFAASKTYTAQVLQARNLRVHHITWVRSKANIADNASRTAINTSALASAHLVQSITPTSATASASKDTRQ
jgi:hypothetical protein